LGARLLHHSYPPRARAEHEDVAPFGTDAPMSYASPTAARARYPQKKSVASID